MIYQNKKKTDVLKTIVDSMNSEHVSENTLSLSSCSDKLKNDYDTVYACVLNNPTDLRFASSELKDNEHLVMTAVSLCPQTLEHASDRLRNNLEIVIKALTTEKNNCSVESDTLSYVGDDLKDNADFKSFLETCI